MRDILRRLTQPETALRLVLAASLGALAAALVGQHGFGIQPCALCLWQRLPYALVVAVAGAGLLWGWRGASAARGFLAVVALLFLANAGIAFYHTGIEREWWVPSAACDVGPVDLAATPEESALSLLMKPVASCSRPGWAFMGVTLANLNLLASLALAGFAGRAAARR